MKIIRFGSIHEKADGGLEFADFHIDAEFAPHSSAVVTVMAVIERLQSELRIELALEKPVAFIIRPGPRTVMDTPRQATTEREKAVLGGPPLPEDFGIPKEHCQAAKYYAEYLHEHQLEARER